MAVVAIYLHPNVAYRWRTFGELECLALAIVAEEIGQPIVVPQ